MFQYYHDSLKNKYLNTPLFSSCSDVPEDIIFPRTGTKKSSTIQGVTLQQNCTIQFFSKSYCEKNEWEANLLTNIRKKIQSKKRVASGLFSTFVFAHPVPSCHVFFFKRQHQSSREVQKYKVKKNPRIVTRRKQLELAGHRYHVYSGIATHIHQKKKAVRDSQ